MGLDTCKKVFVSFADNTKIEIRGKGIILLVIFLVLVNFGKKAIRHIWKIVCFGS